MQEINERILRIINHFCKGNKAEFARMVNEKPQTVSSWLSRNVGRSITNKIIKNLPDVNEAWLLTGEGEMLNPARSQQELLNNNDSVKDVHSDEDAISSMYLKLLSQYNEVISRLEAENSRLKAEIKALRP